MPVMFLFTCHDLDADAQVCLTLEDGTGKVIFRAQHTAWVEMETILYHEGGGPVPGPSGGVGFASAEPLGCLLLQPVHPPATHHLSSAPCGLVLGR